MHTLVAGFTETTIEFWGRCTNFPPGAAQVVAEEVAIIGG